MYTELTVTETNGIQAVSARELHDGLEIKTRFSDWFNSNSKDFTDGVDFTSVGITTVVNNGATRELQDYAISIDMAKAICLMSRTEKGKEYRNYLIKLEKAWNSPEAIMARALQMSNKILLDCQKKVSLLEDKIKQDAPKVEFFDTVASSGEAKTMMEVSKLVGIGRTKLFDRLRKEGILNSNNLPYQEYMNRGYFKVVEKPYIDGYGETRISLVTLVYQKGLDFIVNKVLGCRAE